MPMFTGPSADGWMLTTGGRSPERVERVRPPPASPPAFPPRLPAGGAGRGLVADRVPARPAPAQLFGEPVHRRKIGRVEQVGRAALHVADSALPGPTSVAVARPGQRGRAAVRRHPGQGSGPGVLDLGPVVRPPQPGRGGEAPQVVYPP